MKDGKNIVHVHFKATKEEVEIINKLAKEMGMTRSTYIRYKTIYEKKEG